MRPVFVLLAFLAPLCQTLAAEQPDKSKLKELLKLPRMRARTNFQVSFCTTQGAYALKRSVIDPKTEIRRLERSLKNDLTDADVLLLLGELHDDAGNKERSDEAFSKAVEICRRLSETRPNDGYWLMRLGQGLKALRRGDEAEAALRRAVKLSPNDSRCWAALGYHVEWAGICALIRDKEIIHKPPISSGNMTTRVWMSNPGPEAIAEAEKRFEEARKCFDRAIAVAPGKADPYLQRAASRMFQGMARAGIRLVRGEKINALAAVMPKESVDDFWTASKCDADDLYLLIAATTVQLSVDTAAVYQTPNALAGVNSVWDVRPAPSKRILARAVEKLERIATGDDPAKAAGAAEFLGLVKLQFQDDPVAAEALLRKALTLDPDRNDAWELLTLVLAEAGRHEECLQMYRDRLKKTDSAYHRLLVAKAHAALNQADKSEEHVRAALKLEPENFAANVALAVLLLKRSKDTPVLSIKLPGLDHGVWLTPSNADTSVLSEACQALVKAGDAMKKAEAREDIWLIDYMLIDYMLTRAVFMALAGDLREARNELRSLLERDKENVAAIEMLKALGN